MNNSIITLEKRLILERLIVGVSEPIDVKGAGVFTAKIDSGNSGFNVIHGVDIVRQGDNILFSTTDADSNDRKISAKLIDTVNVHIGGGIIQERPVIELNVKFNGENYDNVLFSVTDRTNNKENILLSKDFVSNELNALIDAGEQNLTTVDSNELNENVVNGMLKRWNNFVEKGKKAAAGKLLNPNEENKKDEDKDKDKEKNNQSIRDIKSNQDKIVNICESSNSLNTKDKQIIKKLYKNKLEEENEKVYTDNIKVLKVLDYVSSTGARSSKDNQKFLSDKKILHENNNLLNESDCKYKNYIAFTLLHESDDKNKNLISYNKKLKNTISNLEKLNYFGLYLAMVLDKPVSDEDEEFLQENVNNSLNYINIILESLDDDSDDNSDENLLDDENVKETDEHLLYDIFYDSDNENKYVHSSKLFTAVENDEINSISSLNTVKNSILHKSVISALNRVFKKYKIDAEDVIEAFFNNEVKKIKNDKKSFEIIEEAAGKANKNHPYLKRNRKRYKPKTEITKTNKNNNKNAESGNKITSNKDVNKSEKTETDDKSNEYLKRKRYYKKTI